LTKNVKTDIISTWRFNMAAGIYNIEIDQGSDFEISIAVASQTLDGYTAKAEMRTTAASDVVMAIFTTSISNASSSGGTITMSLNGLDIDTLAAGAYVYDLIVTNETTRKQVRLLQGSATVIAGVTR